MSSTRLWLSDGDGFFSLQNRLQESMKLFSSICNNVFFRSTSMVRNSSSPTSSFIKDERSRQQNKLDSNVP